MAFSAGFNGDFRLDITAGGALTDLSGKVSDFSCDVITELLETSNMGNDFRDRIPGLKDFTFQVTYFADQTVTDMIADHFANQAPGTTISFQIGPAGSASGDLQFTGECHMGPFNPGTDVSGVNTISATYMVAGGDLTVGTY